MRIIQYREKNGSRKVGLVTEDGDHVRPIKGVATVFELANLAIDKRKPLAKLAEKRATDERVDYLALLKAGRVLAPVDHPEPARLLVTGTGLTHLGSADARNKMHVATHGGGAPESDSMKIFRMGIKGGKPAKGKIGVQPEWFFKGVGTCIVPPGAASPAKPPRSFSRTRARKDSSKLQSRSIRLTSPARRSRRSSVSI